MRRAGGRQVRSVQRQIHEPRSEEPQSSSRVLQGVSRPPFSPREADILRLLSEDKSCKEVANALNLSVRTVEHYLDRLKLRFGRRTLHGLLAHVADAFRSAQ